MVEARLDSISDEVVEVGEVLKGITKQQADCLEKLANCKPLVEWLRSTLNGKYIPLFFNSTTLIAIPDFIRSIFLPFSS